MTALFLLFAGQFGPTMPAGLNPEFGKTVLAIEDRLFDAEFSAAAEMLELLPKRSVSVGWDDSAVPEDLRSEFERQRDKAISQWKGALPVEIETGKEKPDVQFSFVAALPNPIAIALPAGMTQTWSLRTTQPRLSVVIALKRGNPLELIHPVNVHNEVAHGIGSYFGLATSPVPGTFMGRMDLNFSHPFHLAPHEVSLARVAQSLRTTLEEASKRKLKLRATRPKFRLHVRSIDMGVVEQGEHVRFSFEVGNDGDAPLALTISPDCACITTEQEQVVLPSETHVFEGTYDTTLASGTARHLLEIFTNDFDRHSEIIPVLIEVRPRYTFYWPSIGPARLKNGRGDVILYLLSTRAPNVKIKDARLLGIAGSIKVETWEDVDAPGDYPSSLPRTGFKITLHLIESNLSGRKDATLVLNTDDARFPILSENFVVHAGS